MTSADQSKRPGALGSIVRLWGDVLRAPFSHRGHGGSIQADAGARRRVLTAMGGSAGISVASAALKGLVRSGDDRAELRARAIEGAALRAATEMGHMKGLAMKMGQYASFAAGLPEEAEEQLRTLQASAPPMDAELITAVVEEELGRPVTELFARFDPEPLASASVGQVHRAELPGGEPVAVKVQYPGVEEAILADLESLDLMMGAYGMAGTKIDLDAMVGDMRSMFAAEFDYRQEAANQQAFARRYAGHPLVVIPGVRNELCSRRVLTTDFVAGRGFYEVVDAPEEERDAYAEVIYRFAFESMATGLFSGDPHPGNYVFLDDGRVAFLDFGLVKDLRDSPAGGAVIAAPIRAAMQGDDAALEVGLRGLGMMPDKGAVDAVKMWDELRPLLVGPIDRDEVVRLDAAAFAAAQRASKKRGAEIGKLRKSSELPGWFAVLLRYSMGTMAVVTKLRAGANWHRIMRELVLDESPATPIGERWRPTAAPA